MQKNGRQNSIIEIIHMQFPNGNDYDVGVRFCILWEKSENVSVNRKIDNTLYFHENLVWHHVHQISTSTEITDRLTDLWDGISQVPKTTQRISTRMKSGPRRSTVQKEEFSLVNFKIRYRQTKPIVCHEKMVGFYCQLNNNTGIPQCCIKFLKSGHCFLIA